MLEANNSNRPVFVFGKEDLVADPFASAVASPPAPAAPPTSTSDDPPGQQDLIARLLSGDHADESGRFGTPPAAAPPPAKPEAAKTTPEPTKETPKAVTPPPAPTVAPAPPPEPPKTEPEGPVVREYVVDGKSFYLTAEQALPFVQMGLKHQFLMDDARGGLEIDRAVKAVTASHGSEAAQGLLDKIAEFTKSQLAELGETLADKPKDPKAQPIPDRVAKAVEYIEGQQRAQQVAQERNALTDAIESSFGDLAKAAEVAGVSLTETQLGKVAEACHKLQVDAQRYPESHPERARLWRLSCDPLRVGLTVLTDDFRTARVAAFKEAQNGAAVKVAATVEAAGSTPAGVSPPAAASATIRPLDEYTEAEKLKLPEEHFNLAEKLWMQKKGWIK